jgi:hypothetical protein
MCVAFARSDIQICAFCADAGRLTCANISEEIVHASSTCNSIIPSIYGRYPNRKVAGPNIVAVERGERTLFPPGWIDTVIRSAPIAEYPDKWTTQRNAAKDSYIRNFPIEYSLLR